LLHRFNEPTPEQQMNSPHPVDPQISSLEAMLANRALSQTIGQAIDARQRPAWEAINSPTHSAPPAPKFKRPAWIDDAAGEVFSSEDEAIAYAADSLATTPAVVAQWLAEACDTKDTDRMSHNAYRLQYGMDLTVSQNLAVIFGTENGAAVAAVHSLRRQFRQFIDADAKTQGREAWAAQCRDDAYQARFGERS
jgi:hypothetical protein